MALKFPQWATTDIADIGGGSPNKLEPDTQSKTEGWEQEIPLLQHMNWIQNNFATWLRRSNEHVQTVDGTTLEVGSINVVNAGDVVYLPNDAVPGQSVTILQSQDTDFSIIPATVVGNGLPIVMPSFSTFELDTTNGIFQFFHDTNRWGVNLLGEVGTGDPSKEARSSDFFTGLFGAGTDNAKAGIVRTVEFTGAQGQDTFAFAYDGGDVIHVYLNGFRLSTGDFTRPDGSNIVLTGAALDEQNDLLVITAWGTAYSEIDGGTY